MTELPPVRLMFPSVSVETTPGVVLPRREKPVLSRCGAVERQVRFVAGAAEPVADIHSRVVDLEASPSGSR